MTKSACNSGFALLLVLWMLVTVSAIALALAASAGTEVRAAQDSWADLQAERLASSGHEFAAYLLTRGMGSSSEDLSGLPVTSIIPGYKYQITLDGGSIDLVLEGENAKLDLQAADNDTVAGFFAAWTGDPQRGEQIAQGIQSWKTGNSGLAAAHFLLIDGVLPQDLSPKIIPANDGPQARAALSNFVAMTPTGNSINVNYASSTVLQALPGMTPKLLDSILELRQVSIFINSQDFQDRLNLPSDSPLLKQLAFDRGTAPAVLSLGRIQSSSRVRSERRLLVKLPVPQNRGVATQVVGSIERGIQTIDQP